MCKSPLHPLLTALPKCEHHMHLEGALSPTLLFNLSRKNNIPLPASNPAYTSLETLTTRYASFSSLSDFLTYYTTAQSVLLTPSDFEDLAWDYFQRAHAQGVRHAEVFFDPQAHTTRGVAYETVISGFTTACQRAERELGLSTLLIMCFLRHLPVPHALETLNTALPDLESGKLAGIGLDSNELPFPPPLFSELYAIAASKEIKRTAHAGEEAPAGYVRAALDELSVQRIDHGIRLADDAELMARVAREQTLVTVCPLSNVLLQCVPSVAELPIRRFLEAGVQFSINSDDPAYFGGYIQENYCAVQDAFELSAQEWRGICEAGIRGSWCAEERKGELRGFVEEVMTRWDRGEIQA
ncbi:MAG: adenine deaminase [Vezdaea acicularis]|nr:MAG: adenine deaminase [Vezdaea acicularis]